MVPFDLLFLKPRLPVDQVTSNHDRVSSRTILTVIELDLLRYISIDLEWTGLSWVFPKRRRLRFISDTLGVETLRDP